MQSGGFFLDVPTVKEQGFDVRQQVAVHARHLELVFEVGHGAQAAHDDARVVLAHEVFQQAVKMFDRIPELNRTEL